MIEVRHNLIDADVEDIISELKLQLSQNGYDRFYETKRTSDDLMVCCPFHKDGQERKPSMGIKLSNGVCHCFSCNWRGSLPDLISGCFGKEDFGYFGEEWLLKNFLAVKVEDRKDLPLDFERKKHIDPRKKTYVTEEELDKYRYYHPYWKKRGIESEYVINLFDLGYDPEQQTITMPNRDLDGKCVFVARRSVNTKYFNYPKDVEKVIYGAYEWQIASNSDELIVCESMIDALKCWEFGRPAVALNGLGSVKQMSILRRLPCRKYILATDNDEAGRSARRLIKKAIKNKLITEFAYSSYPEGAKDIGDMTKEQFDNLKEIF